MVKTIELKVHAHCVHCGNEMRIDMDKTVGIEDNDLHWLVAPCDCLSTKRIEALKAENTELKRLFYRKP